MPTRLKVLAETVWTFRPYCRVTTSAAIYEIVVLVYTGLIGIDCKNVHAYRGGQTVIYNKNTDDYGQLWPVGQATNTLFGEKNDDTHRH